MSALKIRRVFINESDCTTFKLCQKQLGKKVITYEGNGDTAQLNESILPRTKKNLITFLEGSNCCPMSAFHIELKNGKVYNVDCDFIQEKIEKSEVEWA